MKINYLRLYLYVLRRHHRKRLILVVRGEIIKDLIFFNKNLYFGLN